MGLTSKFVRVVLLTVALSASVFASPTPAADLLKAGRIDDAINTLNARLQASPNDAEAQHLLSRAYYHLKDWDRSVSYGEKAVQLASNRYDFYLWLGRAYGGKADDANPFSAARMVGKIRNNFQKAVELNPNDVAARTDLAEFYLEAPGFMGGGTDRALAESKRIEQQDAARAHWVLARIAEKKKDNATAEREYKEALRLSPSADYWNNLASFYRRTNRWAEFDDAIAKSTAPNMKRRSNDLYDAAEMLYTTGRNLPLAADLVRRYLNSNAMNEEAPAFMAHLLLGRIQEKMGDKAGAEKEYRASLALASTYRETLDALKKLR
ncbi:MAG TPA: tetratricopeptide repeat protein [Terriglobales bacterium]|nr:tetratricopeptide repeat protein [Terriglobales bacterium]